MASLRDLGLSEYEARVFRNLLDTGPTTAKELSSAADVPMGRIYDVLNGLDTQDLVRTQTASRPKKYAPVEPDAAVDRLLAAKKRELEATTTQFEEVADELAEGLERGESGDPFWTVELGDPAASRLLADRLAVADECITMVASNPREFDVDLSHTVMGAAEDALDRGVEVRVLLETAFVDEMPAEIAAFHRDKMQGRAGFEARVSDEVTGTFEVIDGQEICVEVPHPLGGGGTFAVIDLADRAFAEGVLEAFDEHWADADPFEL